MEYILEVYHDGECIETRRSANPQLLLTRESGEAWPPPIPSTWKSHGLMDAGSLEF